MEIGDSMGHLYPHINQSCCIDCGLCKKSCPALHVQDLKRPASAFAAWAKERQDYKSSTSGGAASVLSQYVISHGGVVYGCSMLADIDVRHIRIDKAKDICKLKGSKYVQSDMTGVYALLKEDVKKGLLTLFIGTPCQVAAIKSLYKEQPHNLILVDLICHGVPSVHLLRKHIQKVAKYPHYDNVIFRDGNGIYVVVVVVDGRIVYRQPLNQPRYKDWYINTFFDGYTYRESCYQCRFARSERGGDITIGDFWGLGKMYPADDIPPHPNGCSLILPVTERGMKMLEEIASMTNIYERPVEEAVAGNKQLRHPSVKNNRIVFFRKCFHVFGCQLYYWLNVDKIAKDRLRRIIKK